MNAIGVQPGDEVIVPAITFAATANSVVFCGATPVFADIEPETILINPAEIDRLISNRTKAIVFVDYAGQPCDFKAIGELASRIGCPIIDDACHALGGSRDGQTVGTLADLNTFSFHPVKHITTGEGGMVTTHNNEFAQKIRYFRNHGISRDHSQRALQNTWYYEMEWLGYNYRMSDLQAALGSSQLKKLTGWLDRRKVIALRFNEAFDEIPQLRPLKKSPRVEHAYHLYVIRLCLHRLRADRYKVFKALRAEGIGVNVHYLPVYLHPYYQKKFNTRPGLCPAAENAYEEILTLPLFPRMSDDDVEDVINAVRKVLEAFSI
jgi:perosamine synthetase